MSNTWYKITLGKVAVSGLDLDNMTDVQICAIDTSQYTFSQTHEFIEDVPVAARLFCTQVTGVGFGFTLNPLTQYWTMENIDGNFELNQEGYGLDQIAQGGDIEEQSGIGLDQIAQATVEFEEQSGIGLDQQAQAQQWVGL